MTTGEALEEAHLKILTVITMALGLTAGLPASALEQQVWKGRYPLPPAGRLAVENVQGDIRVEGWDRAEVELTATKTAAGPASRLDDVRIAFQVGEGALTVRTIYLGESREPVRVDYRLRVPRQVRLERLRTVDGDINVRDIEGSVDARTLNGNIEQVNVAGSVAARAINGSIAVSMRALPDAGSSLRLDTVNGNLDLILPSRPNVNLELSTVAGRVESNYILLASSVPGDTKRRARLGRGGILVSLRTVRGNIRVAEREELL